MGAPNKKPPVVSIRKAGGQPQPKPLLWGWACITGWLVPFTSISWYPTLHHTPDLFPLHFQPPEGRGLVASCPKEETQDLLPNTCPTPLTLLGHKC